MRRMRKKLMWWLIAGLVVVLLGAALWGPIVSNVEQPNYKVAERSGAIEIRDYAPMIVAEAQVSGDRREAISKGFRIIADYIFGNNTAAQTAFQGASCRFIPHLGRGIRRRMTPVAPYIHRD